MLLHVPPRAGHSGHPGMGDDALADPPRLRLRQHVNDLQLRRRQPS
jgi:hypothetical protein